MCIRLERAFGPKQGAAESDLSVSSIEILLNGEKTSVPAGFTVLDLLRFLGLEPSRVAVELNRTLVRKDAWPGTRISADDAVEVVHFVGGGSLRAGAPLEKAAAESAKARFDPNNPV
jgi:thiamine biosynthesis protein ThiS